MECEVVLTPYELQALIEFLKNHVSKETLYNAEDCEAKFLFLAYLKLTKAKEEWEEVMAYTD